MVTLKLQFLPMRMCGRLIRVCANPENSVGGEGESWQRFFSHQRILRSAVRTSLQKHLDPVGTGGGGEGGAVLYNF